MTWDESQHPRDEEGKFTFKGTTEEASDSKTEKDEKGDDNNKYKSKNGVFKLGIERNVVLNPKIPKEIHPVSNKETVKKEIETPAKILYKNSKIAREKDIILKQRKNKLLNILGDKATQADILYGDTESLEKKIKDYDLEGEVDNNANNSQNKFIAPVRGKITSDFGPRKAPVQGASKNHSGIDIKVPIGTPVQAIADGKVIKAGESKGYGIAVFIDHGEINGKRVVSEYGHLSKVDIKSGDIIKKGQIVAKSGNTGYSSGPHLHLTIKEDNMAVNPKKYVILE